jgi:TRAP-type mannitol/chloroaromatic compound transport system permease large subunit
VRVQTQGFLGVRAGFGKQTLGFDPVWFAILFIINIEMGYVTPPFGYNLFYMRSIVPRG